MNWFLKALGKYQQVIALRALVKDTQEWLLHLPDSITVGSVREEFNQRVAGIRALVKSILGD